jgi:hypothetical protein
MPIDDAQEAALPGYEGPHRVARTPDQRTVRDCGHQVEPDPVGAASRKISALRAPGGVATTI